MSAYQREYEDLQRATRTILKGFSVGVFVRDTSRDMQAGWAIRLLPYLAALAEAEKLCPITTTNEDGV